MTHDIKLIEISCTALHERLQQGEPCLMIDVREANELRIAPFKGARHIPLRMLEAAGPDLPKDIDIILICHHGRRSLQGCCCLAQYGLKRIMSLNGGLHEWSKKIDASIPIY